jgi:hypothetical protein
MCNHADEQRSFPGCFAESLRQCERRVSRRPFEGRIRNSVQMHFAAWFFSIGSQDISGNRDMSSENTFHIKRKQESKLVTKVEKNEIENTESIPESKHYCHHYNHENDNKNHGDDIHNLVRSRTAATFPTK